MNYNAQNMEDFRYFLQGLYQYKAQLEKKNAENNKQYSPDFNPFQFMKTDEDGLSEILAFLLSPKEKHGQGCLFIRKFLALLNLDECFASTDSFEVQLHKRTFLGRVHDIFIEGYNNDRGLEWVMSIESKLRGAREQAEQVGHYIDDLKKYQRKSFMIFLPNIEREPSSVSTEIWDAEKQAKRAKVITPDFLIQWLNACSENEEGNEVCSNGKITDFIHYFKTFLEGEYFMAEQNKSELIQNLLDKKDFNSLEMLMCLFEQKYEIYTQLSENLKTHLNNKLTEQFPGWELKQVNNEHSIFPIYFRNQSFPFSFCFENRKNGTVYWAIRINDDKLDEANRRYATVFDSIRKEIACENETTQYPVWGECGAGYLNSWSYESWTELVKLHDENSNKVLEALWLYIEPVLAKVPKI
ncbi:Uncharacterised protein [Pasteurella multocida]|nr:Uncharacterised protein [Pasteurella multocida]